MKYTTRRPRQKYARTELNIDMFVSLPNEGSDPEDGECDEVGLWGGIVSIVMMEEGEDS